MGMPAFPGMFREPCQGFTSLLSEDDLGTDPDAGLGGDRGAGPSMFGGRQAAPSAEGEESWPWRRRPHHHQHPQHPQHDDQHRHQLWQRSQSAAMQENAEPPFLKGGVGAEAQLPRSFLRGAPAQAAPLGSPSNASDASGFNLPPLDSLRRRTAGDHPRHPTQTRPAERPGAAGDWGGTQPPLPKRRRQLPVGPSERGLESCPVA